MKKLSTLLLSTICLAAFTGCKSTTARYDATKGDWKISDRRLGLKTEAEVTVSLSTNGTKTVTIKAKSDPATELIKAATEGAVAGALKAR